MTDTKHELKRSSTRPDREGSAGTKPKEKKIKMEELLSPTPTISEGYIQNLVLHPVGERDPDRVGPHYNPCPATTAGDVARDHAVNEWVFNHLPLTEEQKKLLLHHLNLRKNEILAESLTMRSKNLKSLQDKEKEQLRGEEQEEKGHRLGVKGKPSKSRSCSMCLR